MWSVASRGRLAEAAPSVSAADSHAPPREWIPPDLIIPQNPAISGRNYRASSNSRPRRRTLFLPVMFVGCTALIFLISTCVRNLKDAGGSLERGAFARSLAVGGSAGDCSDDEEDDTSSILTAAKQQLELLSGSQAVSTCLKSEEAQEIEQAQKRLLLEIAATKGAKWKRRKMIERAEGTSDEEEWSGLQEHIREAQQALDNRKRLLKLMGYVESQRVRELVTMAQFWARGREIPRAAAAAVVASWRVTHPSKPVSADVRSNEKAAVKRFVKLLINRGCVLSFKVQSRPPPPADLVTSARNFLDTARGVVNLLEATNMKKEAQHLQKVCNSLSSDLESPPPAVKIRLRSALSMTSLTSGMSRLRMSMSRSSLLNLSENSARRRTYYEHPTRKSETASGLDVAPSQTPSPATSSSAASAPEASATVSILARRAEIAGLEKWTDEAYGKLRQADPENVTSEEVAILENLWFVGSRQFAKVQTISTAPGSQDDVFKAEVLKLCEYLLREVPIFLSSKWLQQLSESKRKLEERRELFREALMDISPDSAPPAESSVLQNMTQLKAAIVEANDLVVWLKPFHKTPSRSPPLLSMVAGKLEETAFEADLELRAAGARVAKSWTIKLSATIPTAEPAPVTPLGDLGVSVQSDSVATQAASVLQKLLRAGFRLAEIQELKAVVKAARAIEAS